MLRARIVAADVEAVAGTGQPDIEDDDARVLPREDLQSLLAVVGQQHTEALPAQVEVHQVGDVRIVLDDDHRAALRAHVPSLPSPAPRIARKWPESAIPYRTMTIGAHPLHRCRPPWPPRRHPKGAGPDERSTCAHQRHQDRPASLAAAPALRRPWPTSWCRPVPPRTATAGNSGLTAVAHLHRHQGAGGRPTSPIGSTFGSRSTRPHLTPARVPRRTSADTLRCRLIRHSERRHVHGRARLRVQGLPRLRWPSRPRQRPACPRHDRWSGQAQQPTLPRQPGHAQPADRRSQQPDQRGHRR